MFKRLSRERLLQLLIALGLVAFVFGGDVWGYFSDRRENMKLRAEVCERMVMLDYLRHDSEERCSNDATVYRDGLTTAASSQIARIQAKVTDEIDQLNAVTDGIDASEFIPVPMDSFLERYGNSKPRARQTDSTEPKQIMLEAPRLMITGYGDVRVEQPTQTEGSQNDGVAISMDSALHYLRDGVLHTICRRASSASLGCSGSLFIIVKKGEAPYSIPTVVGMQLTPISSEQILSTSIRTLMPPFSDGKINVQNIYMQRFLLAFPSVPKGNSTSHSNAKSDAL